MKLSFKKHQQLLEHALERERVHHRQEMELVTRCCDQMIPSFREQIKDLRAKDPGKP